MPVGSYATGQSVPASGIYQVRHREHRVPHEVTLLKGETFSPCARCGTAVLFKLVRVVTALDKSGWKIILNVLPVIEEERAA